MSPSQSPVRAPPVRVGGAPELAHEKNGSRCAQVVALYEVLGARSTDPEERGHLGGAAGLTSPSVPVPTSPEGRAWQWLRRVLLARVQPRAGARLGAGPRVPDSGSAGQDV